ncbi:MAG: hypothetical protein C0518_11220 [Opitutus sp.]|nr:hypothetical protein [Opitutus sp.]
MEVGLTRVEFCSAVSRDQTSGGSGRQADRSICSPGVKLNRGCKERADVARRGISLRPGFGGPARASTSGDIAFAEGMIVAVIES